MNIYDYIVLAIVALCIVFAVASIVRSKKRGKHIGCGNCDGCCEHCGNKPPQK